MKTQTKTQSKIRVNTEWLGEVADQGKRVAGSLHQRLVDPTFRKLGRYVWGEKRTTDLKEFQAETATPPEEQWVDLGLLASSCSAGLAVGSVVFPALYPWSVPGLLIGSIPIYRSAYDSLRADGKINNDFLMALIQTVLIGSGNILMGNVTPLSYLINEKSKFLAKRRLQGNLASMLNTQQSPLVTVLAPLQRQENQLEEVEIRTTTQIQETQQTEQGASNPIEPNYIETKRPLDSLAKGDVLVVYPGEMIPVDGVITDGLGAIDERVLTGESQPVEKGAGAPAFASTVLLSGKVLIQVESSGQETMIGQVEEILANTLDHTSKRELWAQSLTDSLAIPTLGAGYITLPFLGLSGAAALLNSHPLYRLSISGNASVINFLNITSQENILVKDGRVLEALEEVDTVIFDKTGTLTEDELSVGWIYTFEQNPEKNHGGSEEEKDEIIERDQKIKYEDADVIYYAAIAEQKQAHPIAQAILAKARTWEISLPPIETMEYKLGLGLIVELDGKSITVGSPRFIDTEGIPMPAALDEIIDMAKMRGNTLVLVAIDQAIIGAIELESIPRQEAAALVTELSSYSQIKSIQIISGDHEAPTRRLAHQLGIDKFYAEKFPEDKAELIKSLQDQGHTVCFVGDGINDSIALKQADVSISLRGASAVATTTAQVVLLDDNLERIGTLFDLAHRFKKNQNTTVGIVLSASVLTLGGAIFWKLQLGQSVWITSTGFLTALGVSLKPWLDYRSEISVAESDTASPIVIEPEKPALSLQAASA